MLNVESQSGCGFARNSIQGKCGIGIPVCGIIYRETQSSGSVSLPGCCGAKGGGVVVCAFLIPSNFSAAPQAGMPMPRLADSLRGASNLSSQIRSLECLNMSRALQRDEIRAVVEVGSSLRSRPPNVRNANDFSITAAARPEVEPYLRQGNRKCGIGHFCPCFCSDEATAIYRKAVEFATGTDFNHGTYGIHGRKCSMLSLNPAVALLETAFKENVA